MTKIEQISSELTEQAKDAEERFGELAIWCEVCKKWWPKADSWLFEGGIWCCDRCRENAF